MCWSRTVYVAPTRHPPTPASQESFYNRSMTSGIQCDASHAPCPADRYELFCSRNGVCCINEVVDTQPFCRCFEDYVPPNCLSRKSTANEWLLELQEGQKRAATTTIISTLFVAGLLVAFVVGIVVFAVIKRSRRKMRQTSLSNNLPSAGTEMSSLSPASPEARLSPGDEVVDRLLLEAEGDKTMARPGNGVAGGALYPSSPMSPQSGNVPSPLPGYSWREGSGRHYAPPKLDRSLSRSTPSSLDKTDLNSNGVIRNNGVARGNHVANGNAVVDVDDVTTLKAVT